SPARPHRSSRGVACCPPIRRWAGRQKIDLLRDQDRLSVLQLGLAHRPGAARCTAAQRLDPELELVAWLERLARPPVTDQRARSSAVEAPELGSWLDAIGLMPTASSATAAIMMLIRPCRRSRCVTLTIRHLHEFACTISPGTGSLDMRSAAP